MKRHSAAPFSYADVRPYEVAGSLGELRGAGARCDGASIGTAWGGRTEFDLDDDYDRAAVYKIVLEEGGAEHQRRLINGRLLVKHLGEMRPARPVRALWEWRFAQLRRAA